MMNKTLSTLTRKLALPLAGFVMMAIPGAFAEERPVVTTTKASTDEVREFCTNIADAARDQRYLLQKQELETLQKDVDERIKVLGPAEAPLAVIKGRYRFRLLVKSARNVDLSEYLREWLAAGPKTKGNLKLEVDVDPQSFL